MNENKYIELDNKKYYLKVEFYGDTKCLKVSIVDEESKVSKEITMVGTKLVIPPPPTPDCVIVDSKAHEEIINKLLELKILDYCYSIFVKFNMEELYQYDREGTMKFLEYHTTKIEFIKDKGNSLEEVKTNMESETKNVLIQKDMKRYLLAECGTSRFEIKYILVNPKVPKSSIAVTFDYNNENVCFIEPYIKELKYKFKIIPTTMFNYQDGLMYYINKGYEILSIKKELHNIIWDEIEETYPDFLYPDGVKKYLQYCKEKNINKTTLRKGHWSTRNIMKLYEQI